jgi:hypothetical protein
MVEFGADSFYYPLVGEDEEIFVDEVEDGLAACAEEQAKLWAAQAQEEGRSLDYVVSLVEKLQTVKKKRGGCTRIHSLCFVRSDAVRCSMLQGSIFAFALLGRIKSTILHSRSGGGSIFMKCTQNASRRAEARRALA